MADTRTCPVSEVLKGQANVCVDTEGHPQVLWSLTREQVAGWLHSTVTVSPVPMWLTQSKDPQKARQEDTLVCSFPRHCPPTSFYLCASKGGHVRYVHIQLT